MNWEANSDEWNWMLQLITQIGECNEYLEFYKIRIVNRVEKEELVKVQLRKAKFIAELKMLARNFEIIPEPVRKIYF